MNNGRLLSPRARLNTVGHEVRIDPTQVKNFRDNDELKAVLYYEIENLVKKATGASKVFVFDHTIR